MKGNHVGSLASLVIDVGKAESRIVGGVFLGLLLQMVPGLQPSILAFGTNH